MRDILDRATEWLTQQRPFALAVLVDVHRSAPREVGASMIVDAAGEVFGNVSAGCVDAAVHDLCLQALATGERMRARYGISDDDAFAAGLTCGGVIDVVVIPVRPGSAAATTLGDLADTLTRRQACALGVVVAGADAGGALTLVSGDPGIEGDAAPSRALPSDVVEAARADLARVTQAPEAVLLTYQTRGGAGVQVLGIPFVQAPRLIIVGAVEFSVALCAIGAASGFEVTVCDPREVFATQHRFAAASHIAHDWPQDYLARTPISGRDAICVLTHDPRFDVPALRAALSSDAGYIGAMGSRRTHDDRTQRLREHGVTDGDLSRIHSPLGLALGGRTPADTAIAILAEIVMERAGGTPQPLRSLSGALHPSRRHDEHSAEDTAGTETVSVCEPELDAVIARWDDAGRRQGTAHCA